MRYHVRADLADRLFDEAVLDIGFVPREHWRAEILQVPNPRSRAGGGFS